MKPTSQGLIPQPGYLAEKMRQIEELGEPTMPEFGILEYDPVIDSADMTTEHWSRMADDIASRHDQYDGFVVLHGTDTMAYTASALAFMLPGLRKPVLLTGSQLPLAQARNDARENLKTAMMLAADFEIPEVCLFFGDKLFRGCRTTKVSTSRLDAFESPNFPPLGVIESNIEIRTDLIRRPPDTAGPLQAQSLNPAEIATYRLYPGMSLAILRNLLQPPLRALVLEAYGSGNGPALNGEFLQIATDGSRRGMVVVLCTQCRHGRLDPACYATGKALLETGAVSAHDMTLEATLTKLMFLFTHESQPERVRRQFQENLVGEITPDRN